MRRDGRRRVGFRGGARCGGEHLRDTEEARDAGGAIIHVVLATVARVAGQAAAHFVGRMRATRVHEQRILQHMVELFQNEHFVEAFRERRGQLLRERVGRSHLPEPVRWPFHARCRRARFHHAQRLARIGGRHAARYDAEARRDCGRCGLQHARADPHRLGARTRRRLRHAPVVECFT